MPFSPAINRRAIIKYPYGIFIAALPKPQPKEKILKQSSFTLSRTLTNFSQRKKQASTTRKPCLLLVVLLLSLSAFTAAQNSTSQLAWPTITPQTKPWTRWWWLGNIANEHDLTRAMEKYKTAGLGGLEITPIYGVRGYEDKFINYLSPRWMQIFDHTLKEGQRLDLGIDMANGTGWPFGGPWVSEADAAKYFAAKTYTLKSGEKLTEPIRYIPKPITRFQGPRRTNINELKYPITANENLQDLALDQIRYPRPIPLQTLMAFSESGAPIDLTNKVDAQGNLDWVAPTGNWTLYAIFQGQHGKMVERSAPGAEGLVIDHFSSVALKNYLSKFDQAFAGHDLKGLRAFFNDSYEVDDADGQATWTPNFLAEFQARRGYDLRTQLPALLGKDSAEKNVRVLTDFRETISDLLLDEYTRPWRSWAASKGKIIRNQSHGSPANILDLYSVSDIPETEGQEIMRMKFATSAAHVMGKQLASAEAATWLNEHTLTTLGEAKQAVDKFFLGGVNHICYHGTAFSPESDPWPGFQFYAAVEFSPTNPFWNDFAQLNSYVARCQSFLQGGKPDNDVLLYYPIYDSWSAPSRALLEHYGGGIESPLGQPGGKELMDAGISYDLISDRQLNGVSVSGKLLQTGGANYKAIVLPKAKQIPTATFAKLIALAEQGATIITLDELPADVPGLGKLDARRSELQNLISQIHFANANNANVQSAALGKGKFLRGKELPTLFAAAKIAPETMVAQGLQFIRRKNINGQFYFVSNQTQQAFAGWVPVQADAKAAAIFDPMHIEQGVAQWRKNENGTNEIYVELAPGASCIVQTFATNIKGAAFPYFKTSGAAQALTGKWKINFVSGGPDLPAATEISELKSWTEFAGEAGQKFSGTANYSLTFAKPTAAADAWLLDLGRVAESARVKLNGKDLGVLIAAPFQIRVPKELLRAQNTLEISVTNLMTNRIIDMDKRSVNWKKFYNTNMPARRKENTGANGLFSTAQWSPRESGLLGEITLTPLQKRVNN